MGYNVIYVNPCFKTLVGLEAKSPNDNPWKWWMDISITNGIGNWFIVVTNDWNLQTFIFFMIGSIGVHFDSMLLL